MSTMVKATKQMEVDGIAVRKGEVLEMVDFEMDESESLVFLRTSEGREFSLSSRDCLGGHFPFERVEG